MGDLVRQFGQWLERRPAERGEESTLAAGTLVGEWRVRALLGAGRSAEVYRVENLRDGRPGALKLLVDTSLARRFEGEREALRTLGLEVVPRLYDWGCFGNRPYYVMEQLQPLSLPLARGKVASFICAVARSLGTLHAHGLVHRDLKPGNILLRWNGEPVLIDLGLVKRREGGCGSPGGEVGISVVDGRPVGVGTLDFAAPEQLLKGESSVRGDVYALGKVLESCFAGKVPRRWREVIRRATMTAPEDRFASTDEFIRAVRCRNVRRWAVMGCAVAMAVAAVVGWRKGAFAPASPSAPVSRLAPAVPGHEIMPQGADTPERRFVRLLAEAQSGVVTAATAVAGAYFHGRGTMTNLSAAVYWYRRAAEAGDADAQSSLGLCLLRGYGCETNRTGAVEWYRKAAEKGNLAAMNDLAFCLLNAIGTERDEPQAFEWAMRAAERGFAAAQVMVAECYLDGRGVDRDRDRADVWLHRAVRQGNARARMLLRTR